MTRVFVNKKVSLDSFVEIDERDSHHLVNVMRLTAGDEIAIVDAKGDEYRAAITAFEQGQVIAKILQVIKTDREPKQKVTIYQGLPKKDKMELVIEKATEIGAIEFVPVSMSRSVVKLTKSKAKKRVERWQRIAEAAAKQAGRQIIPKVAYPCSFAELVNRLGKQDAITLVPYESEHDVSIADALSHRNSLSVNLIVGPEGGFSHSEISALREIGAKIVTLGPRILRTETAGIVALALVLYVSGDMGGC